MTASTRLNFDDDIVYIRTLNGGKAAIVDKSKKFYILNLATMDREHEFHFQHAYVHNEKMSISFSPDGKYLAYSEKEQSVVRVINIHEHKHHHSFPTLQNSIETLCFDPGSHYLIAGSVTGRVYLWNLFSTGQVSRLSSFPEYTPHLFSKPKTNYVSSACFSPSGNLTATSGYGGSIVVTNIHTEVFPKRITPNHVRINSLVFIDENFLAAGNIEGSIDIIDLKTSQIRKHYQTGLNDINALCVSGSGNYLLASGHTRQVTLIDLKTQKILSHEYLRLHSKITRLAITPEDVLLVGCEDGSLNIFHLYPEELLQLRLNTSSYAQSYELLQRFPLLQESPLAQKLEESWTETLDDAVDMVQDKEMDQALKLLKRFAHVPSKQKSIKEFQGLITHFERFRTAVDHKNFALAYSMSEHVGLLKKTQPYKEMEELWDHVFLQAQVYIIKDMAHRLFKVLEPFSRVSAKLCFIQVLLHKPEKFLEFTHLINAHSYTKIFEITKHYPCLKEIQSYQKIIDATDNLYEKFQQHIFSRDYALAELEHESLSHIPYMKKKLQTLSHLLELAKKLESYYQAKNLSSCYRLIDQHQELHDLPLVQELEKEWNSKMKEAEKEALLGHTKEIKTILGELLTLSSRAQKIGMLLRLSYITQIKLLIIKQQFKSLQYAIDTYIRMFGYDTELHNLIQKLKKDRIATIELSAEQEHRRPRALWLSLTGGKVPDTILEKSEHGVFP